MERKKLIELVGAIFIAVIFVTSVAAFGGNGSSTATTTISNTIPETVYATGAATGTITGYSSVLNINIICNANLTSSTANTINNMLSNLEANNSVANFYSLTANNIIAEAGSQNTSSIYEISWSNINESSRNCTSFNSAATVLLPQVVNMTVQSQKEPVLLSNSSRRYAVPVTFSQNMSKIIKLRIAALLTENGTVYGNLTVSEA